MTASRGVQAGSGRVNRATIRTGPVTKASKPGTGWFTKTDEKEIRAFPGAFCAVSVASFLPQCVGESLSLAASVARGGGRQRIGVSVAGIQPAVTLDFRDGPRARASPGSRLRLEDDDRGPGRAAGGVAVDVVPHLAPSGPEALVLVPLGRAPMDRAR